MKKLSDEDLEKAFEKFEEIKQLVSWKHNGDILRIGDIVQFEINFRQNEFKNNSIGGIFKITDFSEKSNRLRSKSEYEEDDLERGIYGKGYPIDEDGKVIFEHDLQEYGLIENLIKQGRFRITKIKSAVFTDSLVNNIKDYCENYCVLGKGESCESLHCPLHLKSID